MKIFLKVVSIILCGLLVFFIYGRLSVINKSIAVELNREHTQSVYSGSLRIATYNIAHGRGPRMGESNWAGTAEEKHARLMDIGRYLKEQEFDIVLLNEVDFSAAWSGHMDQAKVIAQAGEFPYLARQVNYSLLLPGFSLKFGNAILSRYPIKTATRESLPALSTAERWLYGNHDAVKAKIDLGATVVTFWGLHLEVREEGARINAVKHILNQLDHNTIIAGDLNSRPSSDASPTAFDLLLASRKFASFPLADSKLHTFPTEKPNRILDWVLFPRQWGLERGGLGQANDSDHLPVWVELKLN